MQSANSKRQSYSVIASAAALLGAATCSLSMVLAIVGVAGAAATAAASCTASTGIGGMSGMVYRSNNVDARLRLI